MSPKKGDLLYDATYYRTMVGKLNIFSAYQALPKFCSSDFKSINAELQKFSFACPMSFSQMQLRHHQLRHSHKSYQQVCSTSLFGLILACLSIFQKINYYWLSYSFQFFIQLLEQEEIRHYSRSSSKAKYRTMS